MAETNAPRSITGSNIAPEIMNGGQLVSEVHQLRARIVALEAELAAARKDAERYIRIPLLEWHTFCADYNKYVDGDQKMPFSLLRDSMAAMIDAALGKGRAG